MQKILPLRNDAHMHRPSAGTEKYQVAGSKGSSSDAGSGIELRAGVGGKVDAEIIVKNNAHKGGTVDPTPAGAAQKIGSPLPVAISLHQRDPGGGQAGSFA